MCEICEKVKTVDFFPTAKAYLDCQNIYNLWWIVEVFNLNRRIVTQIK